MARLPRLALAGQVHHVIQRGHNRGAVFVDDVDRQAYRDGLRDAASQCGLAVHAYALLDNEIHLLVTPAQADSLSRAMQAVGRRYVAGFNRRHGRSGTLWEGRFRSTVIDSERFLLTAMCFIEQGPVRAGACTLASAYAWSSAGHHCGARSDPLVSVHPLYWQLGNTPFEREAAYRRLMEQDFGGSELRALQDAALRGWVLGSPGFLSHVAGMTDRPLVARKAGRPRKSPAPAA
jgi:putative transposase